VERWLINSTNKKLRKYWAVETRIIKKITAHMMNESEEELCLMKDSVRDITLILKINP
jgi:hypothetical protein